MKIARFKHVIYGRVPNDAREAIGSEILEFAVNPDKVPMLFVKAQTQRVDDTITDLA